MDNSNTLHFHRRNKTRTYRIWQNMKTRCRNKNSQNYKWYGGKGINYQDSWELFDNFFEDMGACPSGKHTIDRLDSNGNYEKSNCKWSTMTEQNNNKSSNRKIIYEGKIYGICQLAREVDIPRTTINSWLNIYHFSDEEVIRRIYLRNNI